ncbi:TonB family C-terminal domain-containing protein [Flexibacter flexilis DSM 6793]|uniref:TonB family C-terminal domain-containing protein n=1 Tax=Flexibacter flexilis DSM 6793 TaxID=927664 RepID=A0A1I1I587_9BACT|nr:energy transducer TonB [Flexibacter flexilis]SFC28360.1 TonB family C-terminal domain-containing protein [Flexibacter flexilis DSM 6793]
MKYLLNIALACLFFSSYAQTDTTYYDDDDKEVKSWDYCTYYKITHNEPTKETVNYYTAAGQHTSEYHYDVNFTDDGHKMQTPSGVHKKWYSNGKLKSEENYNSGKLDGTVNTFWENGTKRREDIFKNGQSVQGKCFNQNGEEIPYIAYIVNPSFDGGLEALMKFLQINVRYPKEAQKYNVEGIVYVGFVVEKDGSIADIEVVKGVVKELDEEALRVTKMMPKWQPGLLEGEPLSVRYTLPFRFAFKN